MDKKLNRELISVLEDVFVKEGVVDSLKGLTTERSIRLTERYISNSIGTINELTKTNKTAKDVDKSKGDVRKTASYADYSKIYTKLHNLNAGMKGSKEFIDALATLDKVHEFLTVDGKAVLKEVYSGAKKSRTGQLLYVGMVLSQFMAATDIFLNFVTIEGKSFLLNPVPAKKFNLAGLKAFAQKANVNDFTIFVKNLPDLEDGLVQEDAEVDPEDDDVKNIPELPADGSATEVVKELSGVAEGFFSNLKQKYTDSFKRASSKGYGEDYTEQVLNFFNDPKEQVFEKAAQAILEKQAKYGKLKNVEVILLTRAMIKEYTGEKPIKAEDKDIFYLILKAAYTERFSLYALSRIPIGCDVDKLTEVATEKINKEIRRINNPSKYPVKEDVLLEDYSEGNIIALLGEDSELDNQGTFSLTEDSLKDFILNGASNAGKQVMKGLENPGVYSKALKNFFSNKKVQGVSAAIAAIFALVFIRFIITQVFCMRMDIAKYLRETAEIIDEQLDAVQDVKARDRQEAISTKLKALADKFDVDKHVSANKAERTSRDFDEAILDGYTKEELGDETPSPSGAIF